MKRLTLVAAAALAVSTPGLMAPTTADAARKPASAPKVQLVEPSWSHDLDLSGNTVPGTQDAPPADAVYVATTGRSGATGSITDPFSTITEAMAKAPAEGTIVVREGVYRQALKDSPDVPFTIQGKTMTFQNYPGEQVWFDGSDVVSGTWTKQGSTWTHDWSTPTFCHGAYYSMSPLEGSNDGPCTYADNIQGINEEDLPTDPQQLWVDGRKLTQVKDASYLDADSFYYDWAAKKLVLGFDPTGTSIEAAARPNFAVLGNGANYTIKGLGFRRFATNPYENLTSGAIFLGGALTTIEDSAFVDMSAGAIHVYAPDAGSLIRHNVFVRNGYTALQVNGESTEGKANDIMIRDNAFSHSNDQQIGTHCSASCGAAAVKMAHLVNGTLLHNYVEHTGGTGASLWCDLKCRDTKYLGNVIVDTGGEESIGILDEVSDSPVIAGNRVTKAFYAIKLVSANGFVWNNTLRDVVQGVVVYDDGRPEGWDIGGDTRNASIGNNVIAGTWSWNVVAYSLTPEGEEGTRGDQMIGSMDHNLSWMPKKDAEFMGLHPGWQGSAPEVYTTAQQLCNARGLECHSVWMAGGKDIFKDAAAGDLSLKGWAKHSVVAADAPQQVRDALGWTSRTTPYLGAFAH